MVYHLGLEKSIEHLYEPSPEDFQLWQDEAKQKTEDSSYQDRRAQTITSLEDICSYLKETADRIKQAETYQKQFKKQTRDINDLLKISTNKELKNQWHALKRDFLEACSGTIISPDKAQREEYQNRVDEYLGKNGSVVKLQTDIKSMYGDDFAERLPFIREKRKTFDDHIDFIKQFIKNNKKSDINHMELQEFKKEWHDLANKQTAAERMIIDPDKEKQKEGKQQMDNCMQYMKQLRIMTN